MAIKRVVIILSLVLVICVSAALTSTLIDLSTQTKSTGIVTIGNVTQSGMDPFYAPQAGYLTVLNNPGSNNGPITGTNPGGYGFTSWSQTTNPSSLNSTVGVYGIGEQVQTSGSFGNAMIGPQGSQLIGIARPSLGATILSVKGLQAAAFVNGAGSVTFMEGIDVLGSNTPGGLITGGAVVAEMIGIHVGPQSGAVNNFGIAIDGTYSGSGDFAIYTNPLARSLMGPLCFSNTPGSFACDVGVSRLGPGSMTIGNGTAGDSSGKLTAANLKATGLAVFANNAAAITGGLSVGDFYRTGANPDLVAVVH